MPSNGDRYADYYANKLWALMPAVYRNADSDDSDQNGPLRELVNRIGAQAAILRRSIDRLWEDQSIEACDDWLIPYIGDLLATNLVSTLDARGQRLDVAKTIYYRRRKGTVALLEELASDITGWQVRVLEFFRRLARTRHGLDPETGPRAVSSKDQERHTLQQAEGLVGSRTGTLIGGFANLRNAYGASRTGSAFDEFYHSADFRKGRDQVGWHNIPRLGFFLWRLNTFTLDATTPVPVVACPGRQFTFDPTGRFLPLFAVGGRPFGDAWVSPAEWQLPTPISSGLLALELANLYAAPDPSDLTAVITNSLGVFVLDGSGNHNLVPGDAITADPHVMDTEFYVDPEQGRLIGRKQDPGGDVRVTYTYGSSSTIGAGPYDRLSPEPLPAPDQSVNGGGNALAAALAGMPGTGTVTLGDSLTYNAISALTNIQLVTLRAQTRRRPVIRLSPGSAAWSLRGNSAPSQLVLDGLFISGGDIILEGSFASVTLTCCTLDPGNAGMTPGTYARSADARDLAPCRLQILGEVGTLVLDRCLAGPIWKAGAGTIEHLQVNDSILQSLNQEKVLDLDFGDVKLSRCTLLGPAHVHRLDASECILDDVVQVEDPQYGCVRFTAWTAGSALPRKYESVTVAARSPLFTTREFGQPGYGQLLASVDRAVAAGAEDGSEMGAFARAKNPIKERSLLIKLNEFMPLGLTPVFIYVT
jgi:hypothetical protein